MTSNPVAPGRLPRPGDAAVRAHLEWGLGEEPEERPPGVGIHLLVDRQAAHHVVVEDHRQVGNRGVGPGAAAALDEDVAGHHGHGERPAGGGGGRDGHQALQRRGDGGVLGGVEGHGPRRGLAGAREGRQAGGHLGRERDRRRVGHLRNAECRMQSAKCKCQAAKAICRVQSARCRAPRGRPGARRRAPVWVSDDWGSGIRDRGSGPPVGKKGAGSGRPGSRDERPGPGTADWGTGANGRRGCCQSGEPSLRSGASGHIARWRHMSEPRSGRVTAEAFGRPPATQSKRGRGTRCPRSGVHAGGDEISAPLY